MANRKANKLIYDKCFMETKNKEYSDSLNYALYDGKYYIDSVNLLGKTRFCFGETIDKLDTNIHYINLNKDSKQFKDILRFNWFSQGYLGKGIDENIITDVRYSAVPNEVDGLWGIRINPDKPSTDHIDWVVNRTNYVEKWQRFFDLLLGKNCRDLINRS